VQGHRQRCGDGLKKGVYFNEKDYYGILIQLTTFSNKIATKLEKK